MGRVNFLNAQAIHVLTRLGGINGANQAATHTCAHVVDESDLEITDEVATTVIQIIKKILP